MGYRLRTADPLTDTSLSPLLDAAFQRPNRESRLVTQLAAGFPTFDPGLSLVAGSEDRELGYALFLPRQLRIRGCSVSLAISSPFCTLPDSRGSGVGSFLLEAGLVAIQDRGMRGALVLGGQEFFKRHGYHGAFNLYTCDARRELLPTPDPAQAQEWVGLSAPDIPHLRRIFAANYSGTNGTELRTGAALDWESNADAAYTLVRHRKGEVVAYLRFRVRDTLSVMECGAQDTEAVTSLMAFLRRLAEEHGRGTIEVHVPPPHPLFRALFRAGCMAEANNFHDEALLRVVDWKGLLEDTGPSWSRALHYSRNEEVSLGIEGQDFCLRRVGKASAKLDEEAGITVVKGRADLHIELPKDWSTPLITGRLDWRDLFFAAQNTKMIAALEECGRDFVSMLFPISTPMWTYSPVFEIADE
jgi:predicted N-acetyltransferase YhbS